MAVGPLVPVAPAMTARPTGRVVRGRIRTPVSLGPATIDKRLVDDHLRGRSCWRRRRSDHGPCTDRRGPALSRSGAGMNNGHTLVRSASAGRVKVACRPVVPYIASDSLDKVRGWPAVRRGRAGRRTAAEGGRVAAVLAPYSDIGQFTRIVAIARHVGDEEPRPRSAYVCKRIRLGPG